MRAGSASIATVLPLAVVTGAGMLAMDLYLPAVPRLQASLGIGVEAAQATVAVFLVGLAASQLVWGAALNRFGPRRCMLAGTALLALASAGCALAARIEIVLALRLLQGIAAGAATVIAPSVVKATLRDEDAVKGIATISMIEAIVPAAGPVLGTLLLGIVDWRALFWIVGAAALLVLPVVGRVAPRQLPGLDPATRGGGYLDLLRDRRYLRLALSHALCVGALLTFVASAPQLLLQTLRAGPSAFAVLQVAGVAAFMLMASQSGRIAKRLGTARAVRLGATIQLAGCAGLLAGAAIALPPFAAILVFWSLFCGALAVRGPATFSDALAVPPARMGRASALMVLLLLLAGAVGTQGVAPFLAGTSAVPIAATMLAMIAASAALIWRYPAPPG